MIKKQLGVLAGAVVLASSANAAFNTGGATLSPGPNSCTASAYQCWQGTDGDLFFWAHDTNDVNGSYFYNLTANEGITAASVVAGTAFQTNILAGSGLTNLTDYNRWGIAAASYEMETSYSYGQAGIAFGGIFATSGAPAGTVGQTEAGADSIAGSVNNWSGQINTALAGGDLGTVAAADPADLDNDGTRAAANFLGSAFGDIATVYLYGILDETPEGNYAPVGANNDTLTAFNPLGDGATLTVCQFCGELRFESAVIPVPAAAWLFGSALVGLGVVRRKS